MTKRKRKPVTIEEVKRIDNPDNGEEPKQKSGEFIIAQQVVTLRKRLKLTQKKLAQLAGTSQPAIARLESGSYKNISLSFLRRIGKVLGVAPEITLKKIKKKKKIIK